MESIQQKGKVEKVYSTKGRVKEKTLKSRKWKVEKVLFLKSGNDYLKSLTKPLKFFKKIESQNFVKDQVKKWRSLSKG